MAEACPSIKFDRRKDQIEEKLAVESGSNLTSDVKLVSCSSSQPSQSSNLSCESLAQDGTRSRKKKKTKKKKNDDKDGTESKKNEKTFESGSNLTSTVKLVSSSSSQPSQSSNLSCKSLVQNGTRSKKKKKKKNDDKDGTESKKNEKTVESGSSLTNNVQSPSDSRSQPSLSSDLVDSILQSESDTNDGTESRIETERCASSKSSVEDSTDDGSKSSKDGRSIGKLFISNIKIAEGSNGTVVYEGEYERRGVAVKCLPRTLHSLAEKEINMLITSCEHENIVHYYGKESDEDFIYLALQRCHGTFYDIISNKSKFQKNIEVENANGGPSATLFKLMRGVVSGLLYLHQLEIVHRDLKPQNVLISVKPSICAKLCDMGISKKSERQHAKSPNISNSTAIESADWRAPEHPLVRKPKKGRPPTQAMDVFSLGCVLYFMFTRGKHPFGEEDERVANIQRNKVKLFLVEDIPEAHDLFSCLLDKYPEKRPKALEVLDHPFFWDSEKRLSFLCDTSDMMEIENNNDPNSLVLKELGRIASTVWNTRRGWMKKVDQILIDARTGKMRTPYILSSVKDLLRVIRNTHGHYYEDPPEVKELLGSREDGINEYFTKRFPKLLFKVYQVLYKHCMAKEWFQKYIQDSTVHVHYNEDTSHLLRN